MSNRHKFRVFDRQFGIYLGERSGMATPCMHGDKGLITYLDEIVYLPGTKTEKYVIEQCTGLEHENGTLIFEGDIVEFNNPEETFSTHLNVYSKWLVEWDDYLGQYTFNAVGYYGSHQPWLNDNQNVSYSGKVIGNINENPELLK